MLLQEGFQAHTHYTHAGEYASKLFFLAETFKKHKNIIHIVESPQIQKKYAILAGNIGVSYSMCERYSDLLALSKNEAPSIMSLCASELETLLSLKELSSELTIKTGDDLILDDFLKALQHLGYEYHEYEKEGSFVRRGDTIKIQLLYSGTLILHFWGNTLDQIEHSSQGNLESYRFHSLKKIGNPEGKTTTLQSYLQEKQIFCVLDMLEFHPCFETLMQAHFHSCSLGILGGQESQGRDLQVESLTLQSLEDLKHLLTEKKYHCHIYTKHTQMIGSFLQDNGLLHVAVYSMKSPYFTSFSYKHQDFYISDDILQKLFIKKRLKKKLSVDIDLLLKIQSGDYIVHIDHGVGVFQGIIKKKLGDIEREYLEIHYLKDEKLFVPITEVHRVSKYIGKEHPSLTPLGGKIWEKKMQKIHEDIREIAEELLKNFAERKIRSGNIYEPDMQKIEAFQAAFGYHYTSDQEAAIEDIFKDMQSQKNMDRLLVGDVGFGKTEVAFNAAYLSLQNKKQVVLISPLVVLAHEHYAKAQERFASLGIRIEILTRLQSQAHATRVLQGLANGTIDMVIGTHRLLSEKIQWKRLGLLIVDEEHKFGVVDKEKIKNIKADIDILSLSATPIPRSLNLALSGVRDISLLKTPPVGRKSISTLVTRYNEQIIQDAGKKELERGGQIFFVHNRVANIEVIQKQLQELFPKARICITHGQLPGDELEDRILAFKQKKYDILLSTTVIENGIDFSNVNTIFINECQSFGISQIHQLRGRVGRSDTQGYCYLLYRKEQLDMEAAKRIQTIVDYSYLGAGFELAMKDLEIRGGGDILGVKQSGQAQEIGISLFLKMLEEKIEELKQEAMPTSNKQEIRAPRRLACSIDIGISVGIPDSYFFSETDKLHFYRELEALESIEDLEYLEHQLFSEKNEEESIPQETKNLFLLLECQLLAQNYGIQSIKKLGINYQLEFHAQDLETLKAFLTADTLVRFQVLDISKVRCPTKVFENDKKFLEYLLLVLQKKVTNPKIKLKKKA